MIWKCLWFMLVIKQTLLILLWSIAYINKLKEMVFLKRLVKIMMIFFFLQVHSPITSVYGSLSLRWPTGYLLPLILYLLTVLIIMLCNKLFIVFHTDMTGSFLRASSFFICLTTLLESNQIFLNKLNKPWFYSLFFSLLKSKSP